MLKILDVRDFYLFCFFLKKEKKKKELWTSSMSWEFVYILCMWAIWTKKKTDLGSEPVCSSCNSLKAKYWSWISSEHCMLLSCLLQLSLVCHVLLLIFILLYRIVLLVSCCCTHFILPIRLKNLFNMASGCEVG